MIGKTYGASTYVSYARDDEGQLGIVSKLNKAYEATWFNLKVDKDVVQPRQSFKDFIEELGKADSIIVLFSDAYFESFYCMLELTRIIASGHAKERVFPIFIKDFRLDNKQRKLKSSWHEKYENWQQPYEPSECVEEFGSEIECKAIVDSFDEIFDNFAYDQAYNQENLSSGNFEVTIQWSKDRYFKVCKNNPALAESIKHLKGSSMDVKNALKVQINDKAIDSSEENIIACLVANHPTGLLNQLANAQAIVDSRPNKKSLSGLVKLLLPILFDPSYVSLFNAEKKTIKITQVPYATDVSAEVLMASSDSRALEFYVRKVSTRSGADESIPGKYHLGSPPEGGENTEHTLLEDMDQHLKSLTGDTGEPNMLLMQDQLFKHFVRMKQTGRDYSDETKQRRINKELDKIDAHYYWITPLDEGQAWDDFAIELKKRYHKIIVLQLDNNDAKEEEEADLFEHLHQLISY